jgi:predicted DCC family thiol-disulfide oxidoreductase YuxK
MSNRSKIEVYTDGQCNLCNWMRARVDPYDRDARIEWLDYNDPEILQRAAPRTREEMAAEMHTRSSDGRWSKGYLAWIEVIRVLPSWKWLAPVLSVWPFTKLGPIFYRWLAARRYTLFGVPPPCDASGVCKLHNR